MGIAEDFIITIIAGLVLGLLANKIKIPPIIGYIIAGIVIGPFTGGVTVSDIERIELLAEIGVALLLFSIGLDFSFKELRAVKGIALIGTPVQVVVMIIYGYFIGRFINLPFNEAMAMGMIISISSTMVVLKILMGRGLIGTLSSKVMIGILIVQDLLAIPLMLIIPKLNTIHDNITPLLLTLGKAVLILVLIVVIGLRIIPYILRFVAKLHSRELFLITITAIALGVGYLTHAFGLSLAFGAFVAGMVINESDYSHQALSEIIPLRDIFGLVFFTSVGMLLDPAFLYKNIGLILMLVFLVVLGKIIIFASMSKIFKYANIMPLALGFGLSQVGEFSFVLARTGLKNKVISNEFYSLMLSVSVITMILSPFLTLLTVPLYSLKKRFYQPEPHETMNLPESGLDQHIIIAGGGRVGFHIATIFQKLGLPVMIVEEDFRRFEHAKKSGLPIIYGDATQEVVLAATKMTKARLLLITTPTITTAETIVELAQRQNPTIKIIARTDALDNLEQLLKWQIHEVVQPEFEASLEIIRQSLLVLNVPIEDIYSLITTLHQQNYNYLNIEKLQQGILGKVHPATGAQS